MVRPGGDFLAHTPAANPLNQISAFVIEGSCRIRKKGPEVNIRVLL